MKKIILTTVLGAIITTGLTGCATNNPKLTEKDKKDSYETSIMNSLNDLRNTEEYKNATTQEQKVMIMNQQIKAAKSNSYKLR